MIAAIALLVPNFGPVFALGPQSQQVDNRHHAGGFLNSLAIGPCNLMPRASGIKVAAELAGNLLGIVCARAAFLIPLSSGLSFGPISPKCPDLTGACEGTSHLFVRSQT